MVLFGEEVVCVFIDLCEADDRLNDFYFELEVIDPDYLFVD